MRLRQQLWNIILAGLVGVLLFSALIFKGWGCGGRIFSAPCQRRECYQILGPLLLTSGIVVATCGLLALIGLLIPNTWTDKASLFCAFVCTTLTTAGIFYYNYSTGEWLPCLAAIAMGISLSQIVTLIVEYNRGKKTKSAK